MVVLTLVRVASQKARFQTGSVPKLQLVFDPAAGALLDDNPMALLIGMLLDQQ